MAGRKKANKPARPRTKPQAGGRENAASAPLAQQLANARAEQAATAEILKVIASSPSDVRPVLDTVAERAAHLCESTNVTAMLLEGGALVTRATFSREAGAGPPRDHKVAIDRTLTAGRAVVDGKTVHVEDVVPLLDSEYPGARENQKRFGFRTVLAVPMIRKGSAVGVIYAWRREVRPFSIAQIALVETFASQAVIAIENVRLFNETKEALERQTATSEILSVISSSPTDVAPVFRAILDNAMRLCEAQMGILYSYDGAAFHVLDIRGATSEYEKFLRRAPIHASPQTGLGRVAIELCPVHIEDVRADSAYKSGDPLRIAAVELGGTRSLLIVPMLKKGKLIGALTLYRREVRLFEDRQIALLQTFSAQAVIAIENVRLFNETKEALERQTATSEILSVISSSPTDTGPVLDAIVRSAARLFAPRTAAVVMREGGRMVLHAVAGPLAEGARHEALLRLFPIPYEPEQYSAARSIAERRIIEIEDAQGGAAPERARKIAQAMGYQSITLVPLLRDGQGIGLIALIHQATGYKLEPKQLDLVKTFADQAVIAIENVRLFNETKALEEERLARLKSFFSPQLAELLAAGKADDLLKTHRREITVQFFDLRGFTAFTGAAEPEEVMELLGEFHAALGRLVMEQQGTIERFAGDSVMVFFNDPLPVERPAERAMQSALAMMRAFDPIAARWKKRGYDLALGAGIAQGYATLGAIGFEGRRDYAAIGPVTNLAARLCAEAKGGQILTDLKTSAALEGVFEFDALAPLSLKGFPQPVPAFALRRET